MFSAAPNAPQPTAAATRSSRRRQRPLSNDGSMSGPKPKRVRNTYNEQTFAAQNGDPEMDEVKNNKIAVLPSRESPKDFPGSRRELTVRGKKPKGADRQSKGDGSTILTTNETYTVSKLPALPDLIRTDISGRSHGAIFSDSGYALSLTHNQAIVWPYAVNIPSPETFAFPLPASPKPSSKHGADPLPLGSLVSASASNPEPGLVIVMPVTGKIIYWDCIASAATLKLVTFNGNAVEHTISGMLSGETVIQILNAETAGFVLGFSTGRLAYLRVRDGHGRPEISVQFLRGSSGPTAGGIFGSLRNALISSAWRGDIAAIRAGPQEKVGERDVVVATGKGRIQLWNLQRDGQNQLQAEAEARDAIVMGIKTAEPMLSDVLIESFEVLDFTFIPESMQEDAIAGEHLLLLTSVTRREVSYYTLVELILRKEELYVGNIRLLKSYTTPIKRHAVSKARLYLPSPALVAYIVVERAVIVVSMAKQPESPESQLHSEIHLLPPPFEDVVDFREDTDIEIVGSGMEEPQGTSHGFDDVKSRRYKAKHPGVVLIVRGGGVVRVAATDVDKFSSKKTPQITAKSKLEQAVFFGTLAQTPLTFTGRTELQFSAEEVGAAALALSTEILKSQTSLIPSVPASIEQNLRKRSTALRDLARHLKVTGVALDRVTRWKLLFDAEKMAAATILWKHHDERIKNTPNGQKRGMLIEIVERIHEDYKTNPVAEDGELDRVRHWFINDIDRLDLALPWCFQTTKHMYQEGLKDNASLMDFLSQSDDFVLGGLNGAFAFREENLELYGLQDEHLKYGILDGDYEDLPEFWTSTYYMAESVRKLPELTATLLRNDADYGGSDTYLVQKVNREHPMLIDLAIRVNLERMRWVVVQDSPQLQIQEERIQNLQSSVQHDQIIALATQFGQAKEAMELAEKHSLLRTLAYVLMWEMDVCSSILKRPAHASEDFASYGVRLNELRGMMDRFFKKFKTPWAIALFDLYINQEFMEQMLDLHPNQTKYITAFLSSKPEYAKIGWIHEVANEGDYDQAADMLFNVGLEQEQDAWSKKVELSLGKLARLAGKMDSHALDSTGFKEGNTEIDNVNKQLGLIKIQDQAYNTVLPTISTAIDDNAELQLAMEAFGNGGLSSQRSLIKLLEESMSRLVKHEAMDALHLVDLLTLVDDSSLIEEDPTDFRQSRFYLALRAANLGPLAKEDKILIHRIIWRRCFLRDDWVEINNTEAKDDQLVSDQLRTTALYATLRLCFKNRMFEDDTTSKPYTPTEVLGAGTDELDARFLRLDASIREAIMKDMQFEDETLQPFIESCRLEKWQQSSAELAQEDFREESAEETGEGGALVRVKEEMEEVERGIAERERESAAENLGRKKVMGGAEGRRSGLGFRSSVKLY